MTTWTALTTLEGRAPAEALGEALEERLEPGPTGIGAFEIEDGSGRWEVGAYFDEAPDEAGLALLATLHGARPFAVSRLGDTDWVAQVRRELHPIEAGRFTVYGDHDAWRVHAGRVRLRIEAAMAFGTGHHGTTQGCLVLFDRLIRHGVTPGPVLDVGCGTAVLAMAAAKAWRVRCVATDIDTIAVRTARENAVANGVWPLVRTGQAAGTRSRLVRARAPYALVFANILAAPLRRLAPEIAAHTRPGGRAILSGLLTRQAPGVLAVYRGWGFSLEDRVTIGDWTSLQLRRPQGRARASSSRPETR